MAGSIRAGCLTEAGTYRPRRWTGPVACAVAHTDRPSGPGTAGRCPIGLTPVAPGPLVRRRASSGSAAATVVGCLATATTTLAPGPPLRRCRTLWPAEDKEICVYAQVSDLPLLAG